MSIFVNKLLDNDFIWTAITSHVSGNRSNTDYIKFNCPMCTSMGETADYKQRGGAKKSSEGVGVNCFNCGFKTRYRVGDKLPRKMQSFLREIGHDDLAVSRLSHRAFVISRMVNDANVDVEQRDNHFTPKFTPRELPESTLPLSEWLSRGCTDTDFVNVVDYAFSRGGDLVDKVMWSPAREWRNRMILPFRFRGAIVGWTGRLIDGLNDDSPKYMSDVPTDYLHNCDIMTDYSCKYLLMPEGVLDAEAIGGISPLGAKLSPRQASWINDSGKTVIVIPDRDKSGQRLIDSALQNGWRVAFPRLSRAGQNWWEADCKDCAEAVKRYGRLYTIRSIIETSTDKTLEINIRRKWLIDAVTGV